MAEANGSRTCGGCGGLVAPASGRGRPRRYCLECTPSKPRVVRPSQRRMDTKACKECSVQFTGWLPILYCSAPCKAASTRRMQAVVSERHHARTGERTCCNAKCKVTFIPTYGERQIRYCSSECRHAAQRAAHSRRTSGNCHKRRIKRFGCHAEKVDRLVVFERDGWRCYLCGCSTPRSLMGSKDRAAPEMDHVVPLSNGGAHTYTNIRCACKGCNGSKAGSLIALAA